VIDLLALKRSTLPMGNRLYGGGGGDGGVAERQAQMKAEQDEAINAINAVFGKGLGAPVYRDIPGGSTWSQDQYGNNVMVDTPATRVVESYDTAARDKNATEREKLYGTITSDASARLLTKLGEDRDKAERGTRFQLARQGLGGGSADIDQNSELLDRFNEGTLEAGNAALAAGNTARSADEKTRVGLINNIRNGMSQSDALSASFSALTNNANEARDAALATDIGGFFDDINNLNAQRQYQQGVTAGKSAFPSGGGISTSGNSGGTGGRITR
jgi:hypothetical protein